MDLRESALSIFQAALNAANPHSAIHRTVQRTANTLIVDGRPYDLSRIHRVFVIGFGKAGAAMGRAVEEILGDRIESGWISVKYGHTAPLQKIHLHEAGHPMPDANSLSGTLEILALLDRTTPDDLVLCLVSGGGSALLELPVPGVSLDDLRALTDALLRSGATINEINALRKHLSQVKGGQLARRSRAPVISLILSDVIGSPLDTIASGPTAPDSTTFLQAAHVIDQRRIGDRIPDAILHHLERGTRREISDTPKADDPMFARVQNVVIADNRIACDAAVRTAQEGGFNTLLLSTFIQGEAREFARTLGAIAREIRASDRPLVCPACLIAGGETTVTVRGNGQGGRNQELALAAAIDIAGMENVLILSAGTDGTDGPTTAAGAIADGSTSTRAAGLGLDPHDLLRNNDSFHFFEPLGDLITTGPTGTNVNDIMLLLVK